MHSAHHTDNIAPAMPDLDITDTGIVLTFDNAFAIASAIINVVRDLSPDERTETIADMVFFSSFASMPAHEAKGIRQFWSTLSELFAIEADHPNAERGDGSWHDIQTLERRAAINLSAAGVRELHLPGCATFMVN